MSKKDEVRIFVALLYFSEQISSNLITISIIAQRAVYRLETHGGITVVNTDRGQHTTV